VNVPSDSLQPLQYIVTIKEGDLSTASGTKEVAVVDTIIPYNLDDLSDIAVIPGTNFSFAVTAQDNIGVETVTVEYWFGSEGHTNLTLSREGSGYWTGDIVVEENTTDNLYYIIHVSDAAGNTLDGSLQILYPIEVLQDTLPPVIENVDVPSSGNETDVFTFVVDGSDDTGIEGGFVSFWNETGEVYNVDLEQVDGRWEAAVHLPPGTVQYTITLIDTAGNANTTTPQTITVTPTSTTTGGGTETTTPGTGENAPWPYWIIILILIAALAFMIYERQKKIGGQMEGEWGMEETPLEEASEGGEGEEVPVPEEVPEAPGGEEGGGPEQESGDAEKGETEESELVDKLLEDGEEY
ncbi:MAG: hypothetical protein J7L61_02095, partial [Thermoplasmata archaeon]|nr:hypothetical protein [Thermoplasmata archaeon]